MLTELSCSQMLPLFNSFPNHSNQMQNSAQPSQQVMASQSQLGLNNAQIPNPFNSSCIPNGPTSMATQPGFMNAPNNHYPSQNNHLGAPQSGNPNGPLPQQGNPHVGFGPQSSVNHMNSLATFPIRGQGFAPGNMSNLPHFSQNMGLPFGQFCMPNHLQNMNQFLPMQMQMQMQMQNLSQFVPQNTYGVMNQALQPTIPQNPAFLTSPQYGNMHYNQIVQQVNQNQHNLSLPVMDVNTLKPPPVANQQLQGNSSMEQTNNLQSPGSGFKGTQRNYSQSGGGLNPSNGINPSSRNFNRNTKRGMPHGGSQNSQFHHMKHGNKKFGSPNAHKGRGSNNEKAGRFGTGNSLNQGKEQRRSLPLTYSEEEIRKWCEERRKNYPSKRNIEKKLTKKQLDKESFEREAELRRAQLKEILAKQAELGVEVAEIPGCSFSNPKQQEQGKEENGRPQNKGRFPNKFDKRGRYDKRERYPKKRRMNNNFNNNNNNASSNDPLLSKRKPTLLEKLLSADITRDKSYLLQAFRFMVANSFFKDGADKPLTFPSVIAKEKSGEDDIVVEVCPHAEKDVFEGGNRIVVEKTIEDGDGDGDGSSGEDEKEEEEGEIIN
ncbi:uncharacterized protein LOC133797668 isoform X2 [Humulus lupulus]|uniref:uncharacterized protein LOC133797668 isoform X2 n=1 Tax=Humulus lupulus TaxID=3486 RepID=UPI002B412297|nr:uncharacterized protein LOC133797668 isoform X2 [Humulus lupulus]